MQLDLTYFKNKNNLITIGIILGTLGIAYLFFRKYIATTFDDFIEVVFKNEGGYVSDSQDIGGATMFGISSVFNPEYATKIKNKTLTRDEAKNIYKTKYYNPLHLGLVNSARLRFSIFDMALNAGISPAVKLIQKVIGVKQDGNLKSEEVTKINQLEEAGYDVLGKYKQARKDHYNAIVAQTPSKSKFLRGWLKRVDSDSKLFA
jgi:lysozyme family protein